MNFIRQVVFFIVCCLSSTVFSQVAPLKCQGEVPEAFKLRSSEKAIDLIKNSQGGAESNSTVDRDFTVSSTFIIDDIFQSGKVLYGDTCTVVLNSIADNLLRHVPEIRKKLSFFTLRSSMVNAFSTHQGYIFVTTGLMARLQNEAQLAFVIGHEIAHYLKKHNLESARLQAKLSKNQKDDIDDRLDQLYRYSRNHEFEADSIGFQLFKNAGYDASQAGAALHIIGRIDESFENKDFNREELFSDNFKFEFLISAPSAADQNKVNFTVSKGYSTAYPSIHYYDSSKDDSHIEKTHPAILKRILRLNGSKSFVAGTADTVPMGYYKTVIYHARLEETLAKMRQGDLVAAYYNSTVMNSGVYSKKHVANIRAMALYGLAFHAVNGDDLEEFGVYKNRSHGLHQVAGMFGELNRMQICLLAARVIYKDLRTSEPGNGFRNELLDSVFRLIYMLPEFKTEWLNAENCKSLTINHVSRVFCDLYDANFQNKLQDFQSRYASLPKLSVESQSYSRFKKFQKSIVTNLTGYKQYRPLRLGIDSLFVMAPTFSEYKVSRNTVSRNFFRDEAVETILTNEVKDYSTKLDMKMQVLRGAGDSTLTTSKINQYNSLMDWIEERQHHGIEPMALYSAKAEMYLNEMSGYHVAWVNNVVFSGKRKKFRQIVLVYHPASSEITALALHEFKGNTGLDKVKSHLFDVFYQINKKPKK